MQNKNHRLSRWELMLQEYNLIIQHIKCKDNFICNVLSGVGLYVEELKKRFIAKIVHPNFFFKRGDVMYT